MPSGAAYNHQTLVLDGETFTDCEFASCRLVYAGGEPPRFENCRFQDCEWKLEEAAASTLAYLRVMWTAGAKPVVQRMIKDVTAAA